MRKTRFEIGIHQPLGWGDLVLDGFGEVGEVNVGECVARLVVVTMQPEA